jgi:hypothetical protein
LTRAWKKPRLKSGVSPFADTHTTGQTLGANEESCYAQHNPDGLGKRGVPRLTNECVQQIMAEGNLLPAKTPRP